MDIVIYYDFILHVSASFVYAWWWPQEGRYI